jgi:hypothetical protein
VINASASALRRRATVRIIVDAGCTRLGHRHPRRGWHHGDRRPGSSGRRGARCLPPAGGGLQRRSFGDARRGDHRPLRRQSLASRSIDGRDRRLRPDASLTP